MDKIKPDPEAPQLHFNAAETYFYNTLPYRKATFTVNPHFISENLIAKKNLIEQEKRRLNNNVTQPVKYRRDYAFVLITRKRIFLNNSPK
jgi:hypothetical protein